MSAFSNWLKKAKAGDELPLALNLGDGSDASVEVMDAVRAAKIACGRQGGKSGPWYAKRLANPGI